MREIERLEEGNYYHIYNRGINSQNIFQNQINYPYFLERFYEYTKEVFDTLAYCLLKNHYHFLVYVKENIIVPRKDGNGNIRLVAYKQLGHFLNAYAQSYNEVYKRTGSLFEKPFKRKPIESEEHLTSVVLYIHNNAAHHGFVQDFRKWPHSSFHDLIADTPTFLNRQKVMELFGGKEEFMRAHLDMCSFKGLEGWGLEYG